MHFIFPFGFGFKDYNSALCLLSGNTQHGTINKREWKNREQQKEMGSIFYFPSHFHASFYFFGNACSHVNCSSSSVHMNTRHTHSYTCSFILSYIYTHRISNTSETISKPQIRKYQFGNKIISISPF